MSWNSECFERAIGLSQNACACFQDGRPTDYDKSDSGLFLFDTEGLQMRVADHLDDCSDGNIWQLGAWARSEAIKIFKTDLLASLAMLTTQHPFPFTGYIGESEALRVLNIANIFGEYRMICRPLRGAYIKIKRIGLLFNNNSSFNIGLYTQLDDTPQAVFAVN